jgi:hypothetical protein
MFRSFWIRDEEQRYMCAPQERLCVAKELQVMKNVDKMRSERLPSVEVR